MSMRPFPEISKHVKGCLSLNDRYSAAAEYRFFIVEKSVVMVYNKLLNFAGVTGDYGELRFRERNTYEKRKKT